MVRGLSLCGMAGGFLLISPNLRMSVSQGYSVMVTTLNDYSPWSYIGFALFIFALVTTELYRTAPKRR